MGALPINNNNNNNTALPPITKIGSSISTSSSKNKNNNCCTTNCGGKINHSVYIAFLITICFGELIRIYVYEAQQQQQQHRDSSSSNSNIPTTNNEKNTAIIQSLERFQSSKQKLQHNIKSFDRRSSSSSGNGNGSENNEQQPHYHTLQCTSYGGPSIEDAQEMVYWKDIPKDSKYVSPFHISSQKQKSSSSNNNNNNINQKQQQYMTFEPDGGGWNNIRMAMETVVGLAIATGRTLVLPPEQRFYLLGQGRGHNSNTKTDFSFMDFFPIQELANDNDGLTIITMEEFLVTVAMQGQLYDIHTGHVSYPPYNRTNWNGIDVIPLKEYLRNSTYTPLWSPDQCLAVFPSTGTTEDQNKLQSMFDTIQNEKLSSSSSLIQQYPIPVNASTYDRMKESIVHRKGLCMYDQKMQQANVLHFMCYHKMRIRMLVHFYAFLFFEDYIEDLWMKRFMRDHMRYIDELQCAAARIVKGIRDHVRSKRNGPSSTTTTKTTVGTSHGDSDFDTMHVRRGDFQYKATRIDASQIYDNVKDVLEEGTTIYIATDERDKKFFNPLREHYDILFLDDFIPQLEGVNKNHYGMIDQLVASRGRIFFGCWHSTFTGFITRMRGYHSVRDELPGHEVGALPNTYYYVPTTQKTIMHQYTPLHGPFFNREFPTSWRKIDFGVDTNE